MYTPLKNSLKATPHYRLYLCAIFMLLAFCMPIKAMASEGQQGIFQQKTLSPILKKHHLSFPDCGLIDNSNQNNVLRFFSYALDKKSNLYGILCDSSAYNTSFALYIVRDSNYHNAERLYFPSFSKQLGWGGRNTLYNASYNPDTGFLSSKTKFHADKDCGSRALYQWTGKGFRLLRYRTKQKCSRRHAAKWPLIYRYKKPTRKIRRKVRTHRIKKSKRRYRQAQRKKYRRAKRLKRTRYRKSRARKYRRKYLQRIRRKARLRKQRKKQRRKRRKRG